MGKKTLDTCKTWREVDQVIRSDTRVTEIRQTGSHVIVHGPKPGAAVYPLHNGDAPKGTLKAFLKIAALIGLVVMFITCPASLAYLQAFIQIPG